LDKKYTTIRVNKKVTKLDIKEVIFTALSFGEIISVKSYNVPKPIMLRPFTIDGSNNAVTNAATTSFNAKPIVKANADINIVPVDVCKKALICCLSVRLFV
jgi:hypothetical protein